MPTIARLVTLNDAAAQPFAPLSQRTARLLLAQGLTTVEDVTALYPLALLEIRGFGFKSLREIERCFLPGRYYDPRKDPIR